MNCKAKNIIIKKEPTCEGSFNNKKRFLKIYN